MNLRGLAGPRGRPVILGVTASAVLLANLAGILVAGVTVALPHLLYVPIALSGYWYPRRGTAVAVLIASAYSAFALPLVPGEGVAIVARGVTLVAVGALIAYLSRRLRDQEALYRGLYDHSVSGILLLGPDNRIEDANPRASDLLGQAPEDLRGRPFAECASDREAAERFLVALERGAVAEQELALVRADGRTVHCLASGAPLEVGRRVVTLADMTGLHRARAALEAANRTMAHLAGILDRDLARATGDLEACLARIRREIADPEVLALLRPLGERIGALRRRNEVSREFRVLGTRPPAWQRVQDAIEEAQARLDPGPVAVRAWTARLELYADPALPVALYHLLDNATRPDTGATAVIVTYHDGDGGCRIVVEDDGTGVPPGERDRLFEPTDDRYGHGLFLAREILGITGIGIAEEGTGKGARFVLTVPPEVCRVV